MQKGRIAKIKKTNLLKMSAIINAIVALFFILFSILYFQRYDLWFFIFSFFVGTHLLSKSWLFKSDSSCYFGSLVFFIGIMGLFIILFQLSYGAVYFLFATALSSIMVLIFFRQIFHLFLASIFTYEGVILYMFLVNIINLTIFLILNSILLFIFLFVCVIIFKKVKKGS